MIKREQVPYMHKDQSTAQKSSDQTSLRIIHHKKHQNSETLDQAVKVEDGYKRQKLSQASHPPRGVRRAQP